jgi:hypothetical protein
MKVTQNPLRWVFFRSYTNLNGVDDRSIVGEAGKSEDTSDLSTRRVWHCQTPTLNLM